MNNPEFKNQCVILLHGLIRTPYSMRRMAQTLTRAGFQVVNQGYPSRKMTIAKLAEQAINPALDQCAQYPVQKVHFVTHSLGGILLRFYLQHHDIEQLDRVVMLAPPNQGSEVVDKLRKYSLFRAVNGPAGNQLGTAHHDLPRKLGRVTFELGIIAGNRSINPLLSWLVPGENDGTISVACTKVDGMKDFIVLPVTHTFIMRNAETIHQTLFFLQHGRFDQVH